MCLKALLPLWQPWIHKRYELTAAAARELLAISPRQMDRMPAEHKRKPASASTVAPSGHAVETPYPECAIDCDYGSEFINQLLIDYCKAHQVQFTRGRPNKKDDNAYIEQKNWTHVHKLMGWDGYDSTRDPQSVRAR